MKNGIASRGKELFDDRIRWTIISKLMSLSNNDSEEAAAYFERIGTVHGRSAHNIGPELYDLWMTCLLQTVEECDSRYDPSVDNAWREILSGGIKIMQSMY